MKQTLNEATTRY